MAIIIDQEQKLITLHTKNTTYQMGVGNYGQLLHLYYGKRLTGDMRYLLTYYDRGFSGNPYEAECDKTYSMDALPQEYPCFGNGDFRSPAFILKNADGSYCADLRFVSCEICEGKYRIPGLPAAYDETGTESETLKVYLEEKRSRVEGTLLYVIFAVHDLIPRAVQITNRGQEAVHIEKAASAVLDFMTGEFDVIHFHGRHGMERILERTPVEHGNQVFGSRRGSSSHQQNPFVMLAGKQTGEDAGECYGCMLLYSGNFKAEAEKDQYEQTRLVMGLSDEMFSWKLEPGETFDTPETAFSYSANGFSTLSWNLHRLIRSHICRSAYRDTKRPVLINNWEATYFDFTREKIIQIAKQAAELGVEMLVLDDGWFGKRDDDNSGLGDWFVNEKKLGGTLSELIDRVHAQGVKFGICIEPEMVNEDSNLYREHPDWAIQIPGKLPVRSRNQLLLDFSRKEVRDNIFNQICAVFDQGKIDYVKWDMNRSMADVYAGNLAYDYVLGVYDFMERLVTRYPDILLEGCSGGGGRFDAGMLYYSPQIWCSDNTDAINRTRIQYGTSFFYPVSSMGAHVSAVPNHQTGRVTSLKTRGITAMAGTFGYELNPALLSDEEKEEIREQIKTFKKYEMLINEGTYWRLTSPFEDEVAAWMSVSRAKDRALVSVVRLYAEANAAACYVKLKGLESDAVYIEENTGRQYTGAALMNAGIPLPFATKEYEAYQFSFIRLDEAKKLYDEIKKVCGNLKLSEADTADSSSDKRIVISIYGGSGSGKTTIAAALQQYFLKDNTACYVLTGDNYPHRIPMRNDEERLNVYNESGEDGLRGYLGTPKEIDFDRINKELSEFKEGKDIIEIKHMGRQDGDISYDETDFTGIKVLILEWTHGGSEYLKGVDIPVFLESSPEETKARRIKRGRDENAASPFICRVVELEQEKLDLQSKNARIVVGKDGKVYEQ